MPFTSKVNALRNVQGFVKAIGPENARCIQNLCLELPEIAPLYYLRTMSEPDPAQQETTPLVTVRSFLIETQAIFIGQPAITLSCRTVAMMVLNPDGKAVHLAGLSLLWEDRDWQQSPVSTHPFLTGVSTLKSVPERRLRWRSRRESKSGMKFMFYHLEILIEGQSSTLELEGFFWFALIRRRLGKLLNHNNINSQADSMRIRIRCFRNSSVKPFNKRWILAY